MLAENSVGTRVSINRNIATCHWASIVNCRAEETHPWDCFAWLEVITNELTRFANERRALQTLSASIISLALKNPAFARAHQ
jgi:hypothetical protein